MLEFLFSNKNTEKVLIYLYLHGKCNASELQRHWKSSLDPIQKTLKKLEDGNLLVSFKEGKTRVYTWNPRCPFLKEITELAKKAYEFLPEDIKESNYSPKRRKRPRKAGKIL